MPNLLEPILHALEWCYSVSISCKAESLQNCDTNRNSIGFNASAETDRRGSTLIAVGCAFAFATLVYEIAQAQGYAPELAPGRGAVLNAPRDAAVNRPDRLSQGPLTVRYLDADVVAVIDDIVGEVLGLDYPIAADVQGVTSVRTKLHT